MPVAKRFDPLRSAESTVIVYFDIKSPYAFIAKDPIRALERELGVAFDWRPLTLNIQSYLGSARLDRRGKVASANRSPSQWGAVKYAYRDARRYAELQGHTLRGTEKIWNTELIHIACSWVKAVQPQALERLLDLAYPPFWKRELDVESLAVVCGLLEQAGAPVEGFREFASGPGAVQHAAEQAAIFEAGIFGAARCGEIATLDLWPLFGVGVGLAGVRIRILPFEFAIGTLFYHPKPPRSNLSA